MAEEERGGVQNIWLLFIALGLGLIVVVIYNVHIYRVRREGRGKTIRLLRVSRDMDSGDKVARDDIVVIPVDKRFENSLGNVIGADSLEFAVGSTVNQAIEKDQWLLWGHITRVGEDNPNPISRGMVGVTVPIDPQRVPGTLLRPRDRVNILAVLGPGKGPLKTYRIIDWVRVLAVGGRGPEQARATSSGTRRPVGMRIYRSITVEVTPDVSLQLANVLTHISGSCWVELISSKDAKPRNAGRINPDLKDLKAVPAGPASTTTSTEGWE
jgi:Flp pilus assembly protein CpaB